MKTIKYLLLILLPFAVLSCKSDSQHSTAKSQNGFSKDGISFDIAKDWNITSQQSIMGMGYNVSVQRKGVEESGLFTLVWISQELDPKIFEKQMVDNMKDNDLYKNASINFGREIDTSFNKIPCSCQYYTVTFAKIAHSGSILTFKEKGKTFAILIQEADEDHQKNLDGYKTIANSFSIN